MRKGPIRVSQRRRCTEAAPETQATVMLSTWSLLHSKNRNTLCSVKFQRGKIPAMFYKEREVDMRIQGSRRPAETSGCPGAADTPVHGASCTGSQVGEALLGTETRFWCPWCLHVLKSCEDPGGVEATNGSTGVFELLVEEERKGLAGS